MAQDFPREGEALSGTGRQNRSFGDAGLPRKAKPATSEHPRVQASDPEEPGLTSRERARRAADIFSQAETQAGSTLGPLAHRALELGLEAWEEICERLGKGETPSNEEIDEALNALHDTLIAIPRYRWQDFRSCVRRIMEDVGDDRAMADSSIRNIKNNLLTEGRYLRHAFKDETPHGISKSKVQLREIVQERIDQHIKDNGFVRA